MQLIKSANFLDGQVLFYLPEGNYAGLFVRLAGTNQAAQTLALTQLGTLRINHEGVEIVNSRPSNFISLTNLYSGTPESASAVGAAFTYSFNVPFRTKNDQTNILPVQVNKTQFALQGLAGVATVLSGTVEIYAYFSDEGQAKYVPLWKEKNMIFPAAATLQNDFSDPFIEQLYCVSDAAISTMQILRDGKAIVDGTFAAIDAASDANNRVETGITFVELLAPKTPFLQGVNQTAMRVTATGAIAELVILYLAAAPYQQN